MNNEKFTKIVCIIGIASLILNAIVLTGNLKLSKRYKTIEDSLTTIEGIQSETTTHYRKLEEGYIRMGEQISNIGNAVSGIGQSVQDIRGTISEFGTEISNLAIGLSNVKQRIPELEAVAREFDTGISNAEAILSRLEEGEH